MIYKNLIIYLFGSKQSLNSQVVVERLGVRPPPPAGSIRPGAALISRAAHTVIATFTWCKSQHLKSPIAASPLNKKNVPGTFTKKVLIVLKFKKSIILYIYILCLIK